MAGFSQEAAQRIVDATRHVERTRRNNPVRIGRGPSASPLGRWAKITDGWGGKYSWIGVRHDENGELVEDAEWGTGDHTADSGYAVEALYHSDEVLNDDIVWLYPAMGQDFFVFEYVPGLRIANLKGTDGLVRIITARSGDITGVGNVWVMNHEDGTLTEGQKITIKNPFATEIRGVEDADVYVQIEWCQGAWMLTGVECDEGA